MSHFLVTRMHPGDDTVASAQKGQESRSLMVMDMGQHVVPDCPQPLTLHQVMVPGLEDRSQTFPNLATARQLSPGGIHSMYSLILTPKCMHINQGLRL